MVVWLSLSYNRCKSRKTESICYSISYVACDFSTYVFVCFTSEDTSTC